VSEGNLPAVVSDDELAMVVAEEEAEDTDAYNYRPAKLGFRAGMFAIEGSDYAKRSMNAIVVVSQTTKGFWADPNNNIPTCSSPDGRSGYAGENPTPIRCASCPRNAWGSDPKGGRGKACVERRVLLIIPEGFKKPVIMTLPPTSLRAWDDYCSRVSSYKVPSAYWTFWTKFDLQLVEDGSVKYYKVLVAEGDRLPNAEILSIRDARRQFQSVVKQAAVDFAMEEEAENSRPVTPATPQGYSDEDDEDVPPPF
jgi:hypothetical protein